MRFTAVVTKDEDLGIFVAQCLEVDIASQGETVNEALADLREALEFHLEDNPIPNVRVPSLNVRATSIIAPIDVNWGYL